MYSGGFPREFSPQVMSWLPHGFVYIASFGQPMSVHWHLVAMFFMPHSGANQNGGHTPHISDITYTSHSISFIPSLDSTPTTSSAFSNRLTTSHINQPTSLITMIKGTSDSPYLDVFILFDSPTSTR